MQPDLQTTNLLLAVMAAVSVLEALAVIGLFVAGFLLYRRVLNVIGGIEDRQVAPAAARINAILDDVRGLTSTVKKDANTVSDTLRGLLAVLSHLRDRVRNEDS
jgi:hypothetical protein